MNRNQVFFFFSFLLLFFVPLTRSADSRQCLPTYLAEWQWLSALLFSPHSHFPVCWWIPTPRHCAGGMPETALQSTVLMLQLGWLGNTADVFVEVVFQHRTHLMLLIFTACWLIYTRYAGLIDSKVSINLNMKPPLETKYHSKCVDLNITTWFTEFPGERESVTCWREPQSDKWRLPLPWYSTTGALPCATV